MFGFIAFIYDAGNIVRSRAAGQLALRLKSSSTGWHEGLKTPGLMVYYKDARPESSKCYKLHEQSGVILGTLFEKSSYSYVKSSSLGADLSGRIIASAGRELVENYWGAYVAIFLNSQADTTWVLRSPVGSLPCFKTVCDGVTVYFSEDSTDADPRPTRLDWVYIAARIVSARDSQRTGIADVEKVRPGEGFKHQDTKCSNEQYWNPVEISGTDTFKCPKDAAIELRQTVKSCIHAWASCHSGIIDNLSGGLDSSIVTGCLKDAPTRPEVICVNYYSPGYNSDERYFARIMARHAGFSLIERPRNSQINLEEMLHVSRFPFPQVYFQRVDVSRSETRLAREYGATAVFSGGGGDKLFDSDAVTHALADCLHQFNLRQLVSVTYDVAQLRALSVWKVLHDALHEVARPRHNNILVDEPRIPIITQKAYEMQEQECSAPLWMKHGMRVPPGKYKHILGMIPRAYYDPLGEPNGPELISPLMSEPIVNVGLRIPSYLAINGGVSRSIARDAFAKIIHDEIRRRLKKGGMEQHARAIWIRNLKFAREILMDGLLVQQGLLDPSALDVALSDRPSVGTGSMPRLFECLCMEVWARVMTGYGWRKAA